MKQYFEILNQILDDESVYPVYQPIVSLVNGAVYGYEALSRITDRNPAMVMDIETMFVTADKIGKSWELEVLCRRKALKNARRMPDNTKLFLNVNSGILGDSKFKAGFTKRKLEKYALDSQKIIFEITERIAISDKQAFFEAIRHYKDQDYGIAIDDVGSGFSGLNVIVAAKPTYIKLDMYLIRNIDKDETKIALCKAFVEFCRSSNIILIAEGIESANELQTLIKLGVPYGQGFFLGVPQEDFTAVDKQKVALIKDFFAGRPENNDLGNAFPVIESICKTSTVIPPDRKALDTYEMLIQNPTIMELCVVQNGKPVGFMTRGDVMAAFGGRYGYDLNFKKKIKDIMHVDFLQVHHAIPTDKVSRLAMQRAHERLYDPIVVEKDNLFLGIVTVKDLLDCCTKIQVDSAMHSNPLTGLPGNHQIEKEILKRLFGEAPFCISYYDLDNFKAYNDAYGFGNGDRMLALVADIMKKCAVNGEFIGHIGGDDFVMICDYHDCREYCRRVIDTFSAALPALYNSADIANQYLVSTNRHGVIERFPLAGISIAGITNREKHYQNLREFSEDIAVLKKTCKAKTGSYYQIV